MFLLDTRLWDTLYLHTFFTFKPKFVLQLQPDSLDLLEVISIRVEFDRGLAGATARVIERILVPSAAPDCLPAPQRSLAKCLASCPLRVSSKKTLRIRQLANVAGM